MYFPLHINTKPTVLVRGMDSTKFPFPYVGVICTRSLQELGTAVAQWLRCCATYRKVAGSIPAGVSGFFIDIKSFRSHYGPGGRPSL